MSHVFTLSLRTPPTGQTYRGIIDLALSCCNQAVLVTRASIELDSSALAVLEQLQPYVIRKVAKATEWPGTTLHCSDLVPDNTATVYYFRFCTQSASILKDSVPELFSWRQPEYPEDLCLVRPDGRTWLVSIAHEEDACFTLTAEEVDALLSALPGLDYVCREDSNF